MENVGLLVLGVLISVLGIVNMTGNISTIHSYNRRKVKEEDIPSYGRAMGLGTLIIGLGLAAAYVLTLLGLTALMNWVILAALAVGIGIMLYAQFKYNRGIF